MKPIQAAIFEATDERGGVLMQHLDVVLDTEGNVIKNRWGPVTPQWTQEAPSEPGLYWLWGGSYEDSTPFPVTVMYSGTDGKCFVASGQWGWTRAQEMDELEGSWWMPCTEPALPGSEVPVPLERPQRFRWSEPVVQGLGKETVMGRLEVDEEITLATLHRETGGTWLMRCAFIPDCMEMDQGGMDLEGAKDLAEYFLDQWIQTTGRVLR